MHISACIQQAAHAGDPVEPDGNSQRSDPSAILRIYVSPLPYEALQLGLIARLGCFMQSLGRRLYVNAHTCMRRSLFVCAQLPQRCSPSMCVKDWPWQNIMACLAAQARLFKSRLSSLRLISDKAHRGLRLR